ncbi:MAG TPA: 7-cyano-7-deazaguanine synthase QueC [Bdellovibrionota bacterium]|nr:7-cyano-7-deazaguanine synthase QueC [Bdellovibrionota bacterium]
MHQTASRKRSVILLSGGLDSAANLAFCREWDVPVLAVTMNYGQRSAEREIQAARCLSRDYNVPHQVIDLPWMTRLGESSLTDPSRPVPILKADQLDSHELTEQTARSVWVPNRNGLFIHIAAALAESSRSERVVVGFNAEEALTFPDNSMEYLIRLNGALELSTATGVKVHSYTVAWDKRTIVSELKKLSRVFPFGQLWSCYLGGDRPCGECESCQRLRRAMEERK